MVSGFGFLTAKAAYSFTAFYGSSGDATLVASKATADPLVATLVDGVLAHSDETDDSNEFLQSHPGASIVPAALAATEKFGADVLRFLRAVTLGYDIGRESLSASTRSRSTTLATRAPKPSQASLGLRRPLFAPLS